jgi:hypothetical protein
MAVALLLSLITLSNTTVPNSLIQAYSMLVGELWPGVGSVPGCAGCGAVPLPYNLSETAMPNALIQAYSMLVGELWPGVGSVPGCDGCGATPLPCHSFKYDSA